ncbi:phosphopyruvate hydratase [Candidatus Bathyarchaeota archaeon]|jgi:enolase|nr:phosphopyruvate hydratase [Candidatus Bathyarchaeota archaeon]
MGSRILSVYAREVFSLRGHPGIEAIVKTEDGATGRALATAGLSIGEHEVKFVYDGGKKWRGLGVTKAVDNVNNVIAPALKGMDATRQREIDETIIKLDGTPDKSRLGGNATASVSAAVLKAAANSLGIPLYQHIGGVNACILPVPGAGAYSGSGRYGGGPGHTGDKPSHEFLCHGFTSFADASYAAWEVSNEFVRIIREKYGLWPSSGQFFSNIGIRRGQIKHDRELWDLMVEAVENAGYRNRVGFQIDVAAGTYYDKKKQRFIGLFSEEEKTMEDLVELYKDMVKSYPFMILEDPMDENDYEAHALLVKELGVEIVGDDLFTTNPQRLQKGIEVGGANCMLLKVNQVGTISEAFDATQLAYRHGYGVMPCASRGEGDEMGDYVVGLGTAHMRGGATSNRLLEIEAELGSRAKFLGKEGLKLRK